MRPIILALVPVVLFVGALLSASAPVADSPPHQVYKPADAYPPAHAEAPAPAEQQAPAQNPPQPQPAALPPQPPQKQAVYVQVQRCTGAGATAYEYGNITQIQPVSGRAQCADPVAVVEDGVRYFGCGSGKIILDCDWFAQKIGAENQGSSAVFGGSSLADFSAPDASGFSCAPASVDQDLLLSPQGKICDLQTLVGNVGQAGG